MPRELTAEEAREAETLGLTPLEAYVAIRTGTLAGYAKNKRTPPDADAMSAEQKRMLDAMSRSGSLPESVRAELRKRWNLPRE